MAAVLLRCVADPGLAGGVSGLTHLLDAPSAVALGLALEFRKGAPSAATIVGVAAGPQDWDATLKDAAALGLDGLVRTWGPELEGAGVAATAAAIASVLPLSTELVFAGQAATGHGSGLLPAALAEVLGWPLLDDTAAVRGRAGGLDVLTRAGGGRRLQYEAELPIVLVAARMAPPPLYPALARRLRARRLALPVSSPGQSPLLAGPGAKLVPAAYGPARPLAKHLIQPSATANPSERLRQLMSGGMANRGGQKVDSAGGSPAKQLAEILAKEGFIA